VFDPATLVVVYAVDPIRFLMKIVVAELIANEQRDKHAARQPDGESEQADQRVRLVLEEVAKGNLEIAAEHGEKSNFKYQTANIGECRSKEVGVHFKHQTPNIKHQTSGWGIRGGRRLTSDTKPKALNNVEALATPSEKAESKFRLHARVPRLDVTRRHSAEI